MSTNLSVIFTIPIETTTFRTHVNKNKIRDRIGIFLDNRFARKFGIKLTRRATTKMAIKKPKFLSAVFHPNLNASSIENLLLVVAG